MCLYYYLMLKRIAKVSVYFHLVLKSSPKTKSIFLPHDRIERPKAQTTLAHREAMDRIRPTTLQDSVGLTQNKIVYLITCHQSMIRFSHPIPRHFKIHNFH